MLQGAGEIGDDPPAVGSVPAVLAGWDALPALDEALGELVDGQGCRLGTALEADICGWGESGRAALDIHPVCALAVRRAASTNTISRSRGSLGVMNFVFSTSVPVFYLTPCLDVDGIDGGH